MALPATIYRATIRLSDVDRGVYRTLETTVARHPSETEERLVARLLAFALCFEDELAFTRGISAGAEPDLWSKSPDGRVQTWIEVGLPEPERLIKASRHAERVILFAFGNSLRRWQEQHLGKLSGLKNLSIFALEPKFLAGVVSRLQRSIAWELTRTEGSLYLSLGGETLETNLPQIA